MQYNRNPLYTSMRNALATGAVATLAMSGQVFAQDEPVELERVETTGSRLSQVDIEGAQPVTVLDRDDIERIGLNDLADVIRQLPSITGSPLSTRTNNGGNGGSFVDIRGMGTARTLVVINGKRDITDGDLSLIPIAAVERIEVLKEGAAAIYGADAVAGVVNIITRQDFSGAQLQAQFGASMETTSNPGAETIGDPRAKGTDGDTKRVSFVFGDTSEKGSFLVGVEYNEQDPVFQGNINNRQFRNTLAVPAAGQEFLLNGGNRAIFDCLDAGVCTDTSGSSAALGGRFVFFPPEDSPFFPASGDPTADLTRDLNSGEIRQFGAADQYNYAPVNFVQTPFERTNLFVQGSYELFDNVEAYVEARYNNRRSSQFLAPVPYFLGFGDPGFEFPEGGVGVPANNAFNPFGIDLNTQTNLAFIGRRVAEGSRTFEQTINTIQINSGLRGDFGDFAPTWTWDVSWNWGRSDFAGQDFGQFSGARVNQALGPSFFNSDGVAQCGTPDAPIGRDTCVPLDIFGGFGTITQDMLDFIEVTLNDQQVDKLQMANATFAGDLIDLPAGPLAMAFGYEFRKEELVSSPDSGKATDSVTGNTFGPTSGEFDVDSLFVEVNIPVLSGVPGAELLEIGAGFRYDDFSTIGATGNLMFTGRWQPFQGVLVRGSWSEVFREPTIGALFSGQGDSFPSFQDICSFESLNSDVNLYATLTPEQQARCTAQGVPAGGFSQRNAQPRSRVGGNPNVQAENGTTWTAGIAWSPEFIPGFSFTADYWEIDLDDAITSIAAESVVTTCILEGVQSLCDDITRNPLTAEIFQVQALTTNIGNESAKGIDFAFTYNTNTDIGLFDTRLLVTYLDSRTSTVLNTVEAAGFFEDSNGFTEGVFPEWKAQWTVDWSYGNFGASTNVEWIDSTTERQPFGETSIESEVYLDLTVRYNLPWGTQVSGGITNLLDNDPPFILAGFNANTDLDTFRPLGRSWFARVTHNF